MNVKGGANWRRLTLGRETGINKGNKLGNPNATRTEEVISCPAARFGNHLQLPTHYFYASKSGTHQTYPYKQHLEAKGLFL